MIGDSGANDFGIFGDVFMRNFYVVFDHGNMKFGFAPLINAPEIKPAVISGTTPTCSYTTYGTTKCDASSGSSSSSSSGGLSSTEIIIIVIVVLVILGVVAYFTIEFFLKKPTTPSPESPPSSSSTATSSSGSNEIQS